MIKLQFTFRITFVFRRAFAFANIVSTEKAPFRGAFPLGQFLDHVGAFRGISGAGEVGISRIVNLYCGEISGQWVLVASLLTLAIHHHIECVPSVIHLAFPSLFCCTLIIAWHNAKARVFPIYFQDSFREFVDQ